VEECAWEAKRVDCGGKMYCRGNEWLADSALEVAEYGPTWEHDGIWEGHDEVGNSIRLWGEVGSAAQTQLRLRSMIPSEQQSIR